MSWIAHHATSEQLAADAEIERRRGSRDRATTLYREAADAESRALKEIEPTKQRTVGITAISAASLYLKADAPLLAEQVALRSLSEHDLPEFARDELRLILQSVWNEAARAKASTHFLPGEILIAVKGGKIVAGGAPLDLILERVQTIQALIYRIAEWLLERPHRRNGGPPADIIDICRPWLFQSIPGSYQFSVAVEQPKQFDLFRADTSPEAFAQKILDVVKVASDDPEYSFPKLVTDPSYRRTMLKLTRNLAPTGTAFDSLEMKSVNQDIAVSLVPSQRVAINKALKASNTLQNKINEGEIKTLYGILRALHLDKDWLELQADNGKIVVNNLGEAVDDTIGPMVNRRVRVEVLVKSKNKFLFRDIEPDE
ncbi:MAG TPA: hypothetical protein PKA13_25255 [Geminicoccaceae bacterium]|nr:hypothetical protein [Geminicoccaceae bacterium]